MNTYKIKENTLRERIRLHFIEDREISSEDSRILYRWETAHALLLEDRVSDRNAVKILMKRFKISSFTAYRDLREAKYLFGDIGKSSKEGMRYILTQWSIDMFRMAHKVQNIDGMDKAITRITKVNNLDKEDKDMPDMSKIQIPEQLLSVNFDFINTPFFKLIDEAAQKAMLKLYDEFMAQVVVSPIAQYKDVWKIDDSVRPKRKTRGPGKKNQVKD